MLLRTLISVVLLTAALPAMAADFMALGNHAALARSFLLPSLSGGGVLPAGKQSLSLVWDGANEYESLGFDSNKNCIRPECLRLDGESLRYAVVARSGSRSGWELGLRIAWLQQGGGRLDRPIEDWHQWLGLPNGGRELRERNQTHYQYQRNGLVLLDLDAPSSGFADVVLSAGKAVGQRSALRAELALPTGDEQKLAGGNTGAALWWVQDVGAPKQWHGYWALGFSVNDRNGPLASLQEQNIALGGMGLAYPLAQNWSAEVQLYLHSRLYHDSQLRAMRRSGAVLGIGLQYRATPEWTASLGMREDTNVNVSADLGLHASLRWQAR